MKRRKNIPTKIELQQLQKLYKTDEKIGERLGGVPAYLVAYWRRKKNIPKYALPKFSESDVRNLWERYGDDEKAGLDLAISKAAFYNWRRRYGFKDKPAFLKLEQLELAFPGSKTNGQGVPLYGKRTMAQKIFAKAAGVQEAPVGAVLEVEPDLILSGCEASQIIQAFKKLNVEYVWNPNKVLFSLGSCPPQTTKSPANLRKLIYDFARRQAVKNIYDNHDGAGYEIAIENGYILPGQLAVVTDQPNSVYGCMGGLALKIGTAEAAPVWAQGKLQMTVPATVRIAIGGRRPRGVSALDIMLAIIQQLTGTGATEKIVEFGGSIVGQMTINERLTLAAFAGNLGSTAAICPYDATTRRYLAGRTGSRIHPVIPDKDAEYDAQYQFTVDQFTPLVAGPGGFESIRSVTEMEGMVVHQIILGSVGGGRFEELRIAADILKGKQIADDCRMYIVPDSRSVYLEALKKGLVRLFIEAGATVTQPAQDISALLSPLYLADGEKALVTADRGLMVRGEELKSEVYICSAATAAASALNGSVTDPARYVR
ncbi:MAG: aconitase family protein [candidate division Zixibacteria bacterium]|nr:aconitase family protein [candidate division Zixibacteria bacterium]